MKSLNCWFKSKDDKSIFQERIPVKEKGEKNKRVLVKVTHRKHCQAPGRGKKWEVMPPRRIASTCFFPFPEGKEQSLEWAY